MRVRLLRHALPISLLILRKNQLFCSLDWDGSSLNLLQLYFVVSGSKKQGCREPIRTVFKQLFDHNADGLVDETELADLYEAEPCMKQFFKTCSKGKEAFTEAEFCSCFKSVGRSQVHILFPQ